MGLDDPVIWILVAAVAMFLFGATKIPKWARSLGQARAEFNKGLKEGVDVKSEKRVQ